MANPSLQIGNSNWAIKEDNLLGYSTAGTRFLPQPITMTRGSAGTRVNSSGLVETVELLGSELVVNGDFATDTDWVKQNGSTISGGVGNVVANGEINSTGGNWSLNQVNIFAYNITYKVNFKARQTGGTGNFQVGQGYQKGFDQTITSAFVEYSFYITGTSVSGNANDFKISIGGATIGDTFEIDNVSVKESTQNNLARVDYDGTASSLLVEPERINLVTYSEAFDNAYWTKSGASVVSGFTSPDGTDNAFKLVEDTSTGSHRMSNAAAITQATDYSISFIAKQGERKYIACGIRYNSTNGSYAQFNLDTGLVESTNAIFTAGVFSVSNAKITQLADGYYLCSATFNSDRAGVVMAFAMSDIPFVGGNIDTHTYTGDGTSGVYIWGAQLEVGSYPTSYIPTDGGTVTRVADQYSKTGISNLINSEEGVLFVEMAALPQTGRISLSDGTSTNRISFKFTPTNIDFQYRVSSSYSYRVDVDLDTSINHKIAMSFDNGSFVGYLDGNPIGSIITGASLPANTLNSLQLNDGASADYFFGKVKQLQVFKTALTDTELATLTTI